MRFHRVFGLFLFAVILASPARAATVIERLEASVNSDTILYSDLAKFRRNLKLRAQLDPLFAGTPLSAQGEKASNSEITEFLIDERMILQAFPLTDAEVEQEVTTIQANNQISREQLRSALRAQGFRFEDYFELIRIGAAKRNLIDREIRTKVSISDDDIRNYYYNHYQRGKPQPKTYLLRIITTKTRAAAEEALKLLKGGDTFEEVAKKISQDASAEQGGELPPLPDEQLSPTIREQLKKLGVGQTSEIFGSPTTQFAILKLLEIRSADDTQIKRLEPEIRAALATGEYQRQPALWIERQREASFVHRAGESIAQQLLKK